MNGKKLIGMALALVLLVAVALLQKHGGKTSSSGTSGKETTLLVGIDLNTVTAINVVQGSNAVALIKPDGKWMVGSLYDYPADFNNLAAAIRAAADIDPGNPVRSGNVDDAEYGFDDTVKKIALKAGDKTVATITIGAQRKGSDSSGRADQFFIRKNDDPAIYLVDYDFRPFSTNSADWIDKQLFSVRSGDVVAVKTDDVDLSLDGTTWKLADLDTDTEEFRSQVANRLHMALQHVSCDSVADPSISDDELGFNSPSRYTAKTKDGFTYKVTLGATTDEGRYARFAVEYAKPESPVAPDDAAHQTKQDEYKRVLDDYNTATAANAKRAEELNAKLSRWTYTISTYTANSFTIGRDELVEKKTAPSAASAESKPPPAATPPGA